MQNSIHLICRGFCDRWARARFLARIDACRALKNGIVSHFKGRVDKGYFLLLGVKKWKSPICGQEPGETSVLVPGIGGPLLICNYRGDSCSASSGVELMLLNMDHIQFLLS